MDRARDLAVKYGLLTPACFQQLFVKFDLATGNCAKSFAAKALGLGIVAGSSLVKLPQVFKIAANGSAEGISFVGTLLELLAVTANGAYAFNNGFPFSAYGEAVFLSLQTSLIAMLILWYGGSSVFTLLFTMIYGSIVYSILQPGLIPAEFLWWGQAANIPMVVIGKLIQVVANYRNGHTGQISAVTVFLLALGSLARIFTSIQETGDRIVILTYVCSSAVNVILALQVIYYWNATKTMLSKKSTHRMQTRSMKKRN